MSGDVSDRIITFRGKLTEEQLAIVRARWEASKHKRSEIRILTERKGIRHRVRQLLTGLLSCKWHECDDEYGVIDQ